MRAYAKKEMDYNGEHLERGEVFELIGARNDAKLLGLNFCEKVGKGDIVHDCTCGKTFVHDFHYNNHLRGPVHPKTPILVSS